MFLLCTPEETLYTCPEAGNQNLPQYALEIEKIISHLLKRVYNIIKTNG
jgi:hypothetical protein